jgi:hypothetical protein
MDRTNIGRLTVTLVVFFGLMTGLFAQSASAQAAMTAGGSQIQAGNQVADASKDGVGSPSSAGEIGTAAACGWSAPYYRHCGGERWILVRVVFSYGWHGTADTWVTWGSTDLGWQYRNHAGSITSAYCVLRC